MMQTLHGGFLASQESRRQSKGRRGSESQLLFLAKWKKKRKKKKIGKSKASSCEESRFSHGVMFPHKSSQEERVIVSNLISPLIIPPSESFLPMDLS